jgi:hypothetical protein
MTGNPPYPSHPAQLLMSFVKEASESLRKLTFLSTLRMAAFLSEVAILGGRPPS